MQQITRGLCDLMDLEWCDFATVCLEFHIWMDFNAIQQDGAPKIAKLPYNWFNSGLW